MVLSSKRVVGVAVHFAWARRKSQQQRIEVVENRPYFLVDRPMGLVDDDQIEMARPEPLPAVPPGIVDGIHHRRVGREHQPRCVAFLLLDQVHGRHIVRQVPNARFACVHQAVRWPGQCRPTSSAS